MEKKKLDIQIKDLEWLCVLCKHCGLRLEIPQTRAHANEHAFFHQSNEDEKKFQYTNKSEQMFYICQFMFYFRFIRMFELNEEKKTNFKQMKH